jgi:hypothetical protein
MTNDRRFIVVKIMVPRCTREQAMYYLEHHEDEPGLTMLEDPTLPPLAAMARAVRFAAAKLLLCSMPEKERLRELAKRIERGEVEVPT